MRLLTVGPVVPSCGGHSTGGVATFHTGLLLELANGRHDVEIVGVVPTNAQSVDHVPAAFRPVDGGSVATREGFRRVIEERQPDVVILNHIIHRYAAWQAADPVVPGLGIVHSWHAITFADPETAERKRELAQVSLDGLDGVVFPSEHTRDEGRALGLTYGCPTWVVPNFVEDVFWETPLAEGRDGVIFVGALVPRKRPLAAVEAAAAVGEPLTVIGEGELRTAVVDLASELGLPVRVLGRVPPEGVAHELARAKALCLPSTSESFGIVYVEAAACGTPSVGFSPTLHEIEETAGVQIGVGADADHGSSVTAALREVLDRDWGDLRDAVVSFRRASVVRRYREIALELVGEHDAAVTIDGGALSQPTTLFRRPVTFAGDAMGEPVGFMIRALRATPLPLKWLARVVLLLLLIGALATTVAGAVTDSLLTFGLGIVGASAVMSAALGFELVRTKRALQRTRSLSLRERRSAAEVRRAVRDLRRTRPDRDDVQAILDRGARDVMAAVEAERHATERTLGLMATRLLTGGSAIPRDMEEELGGLAVQGLLDRGRPLEAWQLTVKLDFARSLSVQTLRVLRDGLRMRGYLEAARATSDAIDLHSDDDADAAIRARLTGDIAVLSGREELAVTAQRLPRTRADRVLFVVGNSLPEKQSGYTIRTHATARALRSRGIDVHVVTQMGWPPSGEDNARVIEVDGVPYHRLAGPWRNQKPLNEWMQEHAQAVADLVAELQPRVLHPASDLFNARTSLAVSKATGVPTIYESRGFWEETWLSRTANRFGWDDLDEIEERVGLPDVYLWRRETEDECRRAAQHVVTLDTVMAERIARGGVNRQRITVIPNAVDPDLFPVLDTKDAELVERLEIEEGTTVIGYISSLVEYEGIDHLIEAFRHLERRRDEPLLLLIVGDGLERQNLEGLANELGVDRAVFTGRVPHTDVLRYYSLIDIFVVPRRPVEVCHLVTPLKPFEAFATGRAVVLSNVRALQAIADQSGVAETFRAGRVPSLVATLERLIADPERRREMGRRAADWVRATRTWDHNADRYLTLYESFDVSPTAGGTRPAAADLVNRARQHTRDRPLLPIEDIGGSSGQSGREILERGWELRGHPVVRIAGDMDWLTACMENRSWNFRLHAWDFIEPVLRDLGDDQTAVDWCAEVAAAWCEQFGDGESRGTHAWYDMAVGQRAYRFAYLIDVLLRRDEPSQHLPQLLDALHQHAVELLDDATFKQNNHGVYVALGGIAMARRFPDLPLMGDVAARSRERLDLMATTQFASDGGHVEHSPDYHRMLLDTFTGAVRDGLVTDETILDRLRLAEDALGWFIRPDGPLVQLGDTPMRDMRGHSVVRDPRTLFHVSAGRDGEADDRVQFVLPESGYAVIRDPAPTGPDDIESSSYVVLAATFHSRTHKHADDLNLVWFGRGHELLVDAGRYGYVDLLPADHPKRLEGFYYAAPERQYVESTPAHNTVTVDGRDHERRERKPYGSGITRCDQQDGLHLLNGQVDHDGWRHGRSVVHRPNEWLLVEDEVVLDKAPGVLHDVVAWWNLPGELELLDHDERAARFAVPTSEQPLWVVSLGDAELVPPVRGQDEPLRGWRSRQDMEFTPAWSLGVQQRGSGRRVLRTLLAFSTDRPAAAPSHPFDLSVG